VYLAHFKIKNFFYINNFSINRNYILYSVFVLLGVIFMDGHFLKGKKYIILIMFISLFKVNKGFSSGEIKDDLKEVKNSFSPETQQKMEELGYLSSWCPLSYQIEKQREAHLSEEFVTMYDHIRTITSGIVQYYSKFFLSGELPDNLQLNSSKEVFIKNIEEGPSSGTISFLDSVKILMNSTKTFIHFKHASLLSEEKKSKMPDLAREKLEKAESLGKEEIRHRAHSIWYILMFLYSFERRVRESIENFPQKTWKKDKENLDSSVKEVQEKLFQGSQETKPQNISAEKENYEDVIEILNKDINKINDLIEKAKKEIKVFHMKYSNILRAPGTGYLSMEGLLYKLCIYSEHPRIRQDRELIHPLITVQDVKNAYLLLLPGLELKGQKWTAGEEDEIEGRHMQELGDSGEIQEIMAGKEEDMESVPLQFSIDTLETIIFGKVSA